MAVVYQALLNFPPFSVLPSRLRETETALRTRALFTQKRHFHTSEFSHLALIPCDRTNLYISLRMHYSIFVWDERYAQHNSALKGSYEFSCDIRNLFHGNIIIFGCALKEKLTYWILLNKMRKRSGEIIYCRSTICINTVRYIKSTRRFLASGNIFFTSSQFIARNVSVTGLIIVATLCCNIFAISVTN